MQRLKAANCPYLNAGPMFLFQRPAETNQKPVRCTLTGGKFIV